MKSDFEDHLTDAKLHIDTTGRNDSFSDDHIYPYEATSYKVLDRLIDEGLIGRDNCVLDYGCGKGRVAIYLNHRVGCRAVGIEVMDEFYNAAQENLKAYCRFRYGTEVSEDIRFVSYAAQTYELPQHIDRFFFFNPFSVAVFKGTMARILESYYEKSRDILLFFYYPQDEYIAYLSTVDEIMFYDEVDCTDLFEENDKRNRILIYRIMD